MIILYFFFPIYVSFKNIISSFVRIRTSKIFIDINIKFIIIIINLVDKFPIYISIRKI